MRRDGGGHGSGRRSILYCISLVVQAAGGGTTRERPYVIVNRLRYLGSAFVPPPFFSLFSCTRSGREKTAKNNTLSFIVAVFSMAALMDFSPLRVYHSFRSPPGQASYHQTIRERISSPAGRPWGGTPGRGFGASFLLLRRRRRALQMRPSDPRLRVPGAPAGARPPGTAHFFRFPKITLTNCVSLNSPE